MKCHLCNTYLNESASIWEVGGRKCVSYRCLDTRCAMIRVQSRSVVDCILPDQDIISYRFLINSDKKWYRIWGRKSSDGNTEYNDTAMSIMDVGYPTCSGKEQFILNIPKFYPILMTDDLKIKSQEIFEKLKTLIVFS